MIVLIDPAVSDVEIVVGKPSWAGESIRRKEGRDRRYEENRKGLLGDAVTDER